jgi:hypothetical protein
MINKLLLISGVGIAAALVLAGCHDDGRTSPMSSPPATNMPVVFEDFTQAQIKTATCTTNATVEIDATTFSFSGDQDDADPRDISGVTPVCVLPSG